MTKISVKEQAIRLRKDGYSYNLIAEKLSVSKSTLSVWLAQVPYSPNETVVQRIGKARAAMTKAKQDQKIASYKEAASLAKADVGQLKNEICSWWDWPCILEKEKRTKT